MEVVFFWAGGSWPTGLLVEEGRVIEKEVLLSLGPKKTAARHLERG
jgi:hypothetical protein